MLDKSQEFNVVSLFDGKSGVRHALDELGVNVKNYYASEINKPAMFVSQNNYPNTIQLGSITELKNIDWSKENIHLVVGGSPCQGFSFNGKQLNFKDPRSKLFFEFVRVLKEIQAVNSDVKFLLENVKMKKQFEGIISESLGVKPTEINSCKVSAANRKRLYWTNIKGVTQPEDLGLKITDILESNPSEKLFAKNTTYGKLKTKTTNRLRLDVLQENYKENESDSICRLVSSIENDTPSNLSRQGDRLYSVHGKLPCLTTSGMTLLDMGSKNKNDWRYTSIVECERAQTLPDNYTAGVTESQRRKMLGNGMTSKVIQHILQFMFKPS